MTIPARIIVLALLLAGAAGCASLIVGGYTSASPPYAISERARALRAEMLIVDLHADSLLWATDLLEKNGRGHVDLPRLVEGGVAAQVFSIVTKSPAGLNIDRNDDSSDTIWYLARAHGWPQAARNSLLERALYQADKLHAFAARADGRLVVVKSRADWDAFVNRRGARRDVVAGLLAIEGAHALEGSLANLDRLFAAGIRMISPSHFFDTDVGGSAHGVAKGGLTELGRRLIAAMEDRGVIVDVAHASVRTIADVVAVARKPVVVSHTGVQGTCDNVRNLSDDQLRAIARTGGVIGIGYWPTAVCGSDAGAIVRAIRHTMGVVGVRHVALGSDFDGATTTPFDATGVGQLIDGLLGEGVSEADIRKIMGENVSSLLSRLLPE